MNLFKLEQHKNEHIKNLFKKIQDRFLNVSCKTVLLVYAKTRKLALPVHTSENMDSVSASY